MKKLRNFYFITGLAAIAFALLASLIPGVTITDFVRGFCHGLGVTMLIAGVITSAIPVFCKKKGTQAAHDPKAPAANHGASQTPAGHESGERESQK